MGLSTAIAKVLGINTKEKTAAFDWTPYIVNPHDFRTWMDFRPEEAATRAGELKAELAKVKRDDLFGNLELKIAADKDGKTILLLTVPRANVRPDYSQPSPRSVTPWDEEATAAMPLADGVAAMADEAKNPDLELSRRRRILREEARQLEEDRRQSELAQQKAKAEAEEYARRLELWSERPQLERVLLQAAKAHPKDPVMQTLLSILSTEPQEPTRVPDWFETNG